eukprot:scaffold421357_cov86-Attheya_sp.AAC.2
MDILHSSATRRLKQNWYFDTLFSKVESIKGNTCTSVFTNGNMAFVDPLQSKSDVSTAALQHMAQVIGYPKTLILDGLGLGTNTLTKGGSLSPIPHGRTK